MYCEEGEQGTKCLEKTYTEYIDSIAITYIGFVASYGWCKHECDAVRRCMGFAFHGTRSTHGHCALAKAANTFIQNWFYDVYVKTNCLIDERIQSNHRHGPRIEHHIQTVRFKVVTTPEPPAPTVCVPITQHTNPTFDRLIYCY
ncbi:hypothetical protein ACOME3_005289 [Neoechinorhynchus agilis]